MQEKDIFMNTVDRMIQDFKEKKEPTKRESKIYFCNLFIETLKNMTKTELAKYMKEIYGDMNEGTIHVVFHSKFLEEKKELWKSKNKKYPMF